MSFKRLYSPPHLIFQLEDTENLDDRREIRKQLRELRNKKFEEEMKKVTANDYRPGRTKTALSNGVDSTLSSLGRKGSIEKKEDEKDVHGISQLETEEELQALVSTQCPSIQNLFSDCYSLSSFRRVYS